MLYNMFTGESLYKGDDSELILMQIRKTPPATLLSNLKPDENCPPGEFDLFVDLLGECLVPEQSSRANVEKLIKHPFWKGKIKDTLEKDLNNTVVESISVKHSSLEPLEIGSRTSFSQNMNSMDSNRTLTNSVLCEAGFGDWRFDHKSTSRRTLN